MCLLLSKTPHGEFNLKFGHNIVKLRIVSTLRLVCCGDIRCVRNEVQQEERNEGRQTIKTGGKRRGRGVMNKMTERAGDWELKS